tara:strand:- start:3556 stop:3921 length:366 start_codon:yes stop_codon:yes gene_type:complete
MDITIDASFVFKGYHEIDHAGMALVIDKDDKKFIATLNATGEDCPFDVNSLRELDECVMQGCALHEDLATISAVTPYFEHNDINFLTEKVMQYHNRGQISREYHVSLCANSDRDNRWINFN